MEADTEPTIWEKDAALAKIWQRDFPVIYYVPSQDQLIFSQ